jgi:hypothetical protein
MGWDTIEIDLDPTDVTITFACRALNTECQCKSGEFGMLFHLDAIDHAKRLQTKMREIGDG